jgi:hypothetical protein
VYELRVEYAAADPDDDQPVHLWHVVRDDAPETLCGHVLSPAAPRLPVAEWDQVASWGCARCHEAYRRTLPPPD